MGVYTPSSVSRGRGVLGRVLENQWEGESYMYMYTYICIYIYTYIRTYMWICVRVYTYIYMPISTLISRLYMNAHKSEGIPMSLPEGTQSWVCC